MSRVNLPDDALAERYEAGASLSRLALVYGVSPSTVRRRLKRQGVVMRGSGEHNGIPLPVADIVRRYGAGEGTPVLGRAYEVSTNTIVRRLHVAGVKLRPRGAPLGHRYGLGNTNGHRPGGPLHVSGKGYLCTYDRAGKGCRVHRACWEACRGAIPGGWVVHHINGEKTDNRIENLACMTHGEHTSWHKRRAGDRESVLASK